MGGVYFTLSASVAVHFVKGSGIHDLQVASLLPQVPLFIKVMRALMMMIQDSFFPVKNSMSGSDIGINQLEILLRSPTMHSTKNQLQISNRIVHHVPTDDLTGCKDVRLASHYVAHLVFQKLARNSMNDVVSFLTGTLGDYHCSTIRGQLLESYTIHHLAAGEDAS